MINLIQQHWYWFIGICFAVVEFAESLNDKDERYSIAVLILSAVTSSIIVAILWPFFMVVRIIARYL